MIELDPGFADPVHDSQQIFRAVMTALARPAQPLPFPHVAPKAPPPLSPLLAAILLALVDSDTPLWLDAELAASRDVLAWLRFHTGVPIVEDNAAASFAAVSRSGNLLDLTTFAPGGFASPERSTTVLLGVEGFVESGWNCEGPGIDSGVRFGVRGLAGDFLTQWQRNTQRFPLGIDLLLVAPGAIAGLTRTTRLSEV